MQQMNRTHANGEEKNRLRQFKQPDRQQTAVMRRSGVIPLLFRLDQLVIDARPVCHMQSSVDGEPMELSTSPSLSPHLDSLNNFSSHLRPHNRDVASILRD